MKTKTYTTEQIEKEFEKIEKLGYQVSTGEDGCQIWDGTILMIDADFFDTYEENANDAINSFWNDR